MDVSDVFSPPFPQPLPPPRSVPHSLSRHIPWDLPSPEVSHHLPVAILDDHSPKESLQSPEAFTFSPATGTIPSTYDFWSNPTGSSPSGQRPRLMHLCPKASTLDKELLHEHLGHDQTRVPALAEREVNTHYLWTTTHSSAFRKPPQRHPFPPGLWRETHAIISKSFFMSVLKSW